jgi:cellulose synthase (UDP-forming)
MIEVTRNRRARYLRNCRLLVAASIVMAVWYLWWLLFDAPMSNPILFRVLMAAELFNVTQAAGFWYTIWTQRWTEPADADFPSTRETVDVFVTVCGEPPGIVEKTVRAVAAIRHPRLRVWVLDDGGSDQVESIASWYGARYLARPGRRGAKAGNINNALRKSDGDFIVIFDADHAPVPSFLERTMRCFEDPRVAYVQTPQSYRNRMVNRVASGAHEQQALFYGPILRGKDSAGAVFSCGTNVIFRRAALDDVGGMPEDSITEDLRVSLMLNRRGWRSVYVPEILAHGLGPLDVGSYFGQQRRWALGSLEILLTKRPFHRRMGFSTFVQYALSFLFWFNGWAYASYIILTLSFLLFGLSPVQVRNEYPIHFLPYVGTTMFTMIYASDFGLTFQGVWFTLGSFPAQIRALLSALTRRTKSFVVTSKTRRTASLRPVRAHIAVIALLAVSIVFGVWRLGYNPSVMNNVAFAIGHIIVLQGFVRYALRPEALEGELRDPDAPEVLTPEQQARAAAAIEPASMTSDWGALGE